MSEGPLHRRQGRQRERRDKCVFVVEAQVLLYTRAWRYALDPRVRVAGTT
jgi:hypothetical protein